MFADFLFGIFVFALGVCIGSFLNCVIYRLEEKKSLKGRSFCPHCKHILDWKDLVPVFSFLFLAGRCRYCKAKISWQYPAAELATGVIFLLTFNYTLNLARANFTVYLDLVNLANLALLFYIASALIIIFIYDLKHYLIPDKILFPAIFIVFLFRILNFLQIWDYLLAVIIAAGFFLAIFLISGGRWMGFGDVKLAVLLGLLLGFPNILAVLFLAFFFGAIIGIILMVLNKKGLKSEIPFGPFLIAGTFLAFFWGGAIINWYLNLFL